VRRYVRAHLRDPALDPDAIARAHAISVRALHALFEASDESVAGLVRRERLARCYEDLELASGGSVTEIAFRWGFRDAAHFSRVFKREFELTPSEVRHAALERNDDDAPGNAAGDARIGNGSGAPAPARTPRLN
jgi:AraC family transcriptional regulator, positive regulator of tynA and feaB